MRVYLLWGDTSKTGRSLILLFAFQIQKAAGRHSEETLPTARQGGWQVDERTTAGWARSQGPSPAGDMEGERGDSSLAEVWAKSLSPGEPQAQRTNRGLPLYRERPSCGAANADPAVSTPHILLAWPSPPPTCPAAPKITSHAFCSCFFFYLIPEKKPRFSVKCSKAIPGHKRRREQHRQRWGNLKCTRAGWNGVLVLSGNNKAEAVTLWPSLDVEDPEGDTLKVVGSPADVPTESTCSGS